MSLFSSFQKRSTLDAAIKQVAKARKSEGGKAEQLYIGAYLGFAKVIADNPIVAEALYNWGFALLHEAGTQANEQARVTLEEAVSKFSFCLLTAPSYLGAAIDGGVALMALARLSDADEQIKLYQQAKQFFETADSIQKGSAAYNLACISALLGNEEDCLAALQLAQQRGSLPDEALILQDADLVTVHELVWFKEFIEQLKLKPEVEEKLEELAVSIEPKLNIRKTEDFDYYSKH